MNNQIKFEIHQGWGDVDLSGLVNALTEKIPTEKETSTTSELRATKYHLEDLRKLVKGLHD